jgi:hypothetical protein
MHATTITEGDVKALQKSQSKTLRLTVLITVPLVIIFLIVAGCLDLYLCARFSSRAGISMAEVIRGWFAGIDPSAKYSGIYLWALDSWIQAILHFSEAVFFAIMFVVYQLESKRNARILRFIEQKGI